MKMNDILDNVFLVCESFKRENHLGLEDYYSQFDEQLFQFYICINADNAFTIETIYPYNGISILYIDTEQKEKVGNNEYTRNLALKQMVELSLYFHAMSHFFEEYTTINTSFVKYKDEEILRLHGQRFHTSGQREAYRMEMNRRLSEYYRHLYPKAFSQFGDSVNIERLMMPQYLLQQILREYERLLRERRKRRIR